MLLMKWNFRSWNRYAGGYGQCGFERRKSYTAPIRKVWKGRAIAVIRSTKQNGKVKLKVASKGLSPASVIIKTKR